MSIDVLNRQLQDKLFSTGFGFLKKNDYVQLRDAVITCLNKVSGSDEQLETFLGAATQFGAAADTIGYYDKMLLAKTQIVSISEKDGLSITEFVDKWKVKPIEKRIVKIKKEGPWSSDQLGYFGSRDVLDVLNPNKFKVPRTEEENELAMGELRRLKESCLAAFYGDVGFLDWLSTIDVTKVFGFKFLHVFHAIRIGIETGYFTKEDELPSVDEMAAVIQGHHVLIRDAKTCLRNKKIIRVSPNRRHMYVN